MTTSRNTTIRPLTIGLLILLAALSRLLPHPPNFAPVAAMALFGGAYFGSRIWAFAAPIIAMIISDMLLVVMGLSPSVIHATTPHVYIAMTLTVGLGLLLRNRKGLVRTTGLALASSVLFFLITNFGVWHTAPDFYTQDLSGLMACYTAAIPFFQYSVLGDLFYTGVLFGGFALLARRFPRQMAAA